MRSDLWLEKLFVVSSYIRFVIAIYGMIFLKQQKWVKKFMGYFKFYSRQKNHFTTRILLFKISEEVNINKNDNWKQMTWAMAL